MKAFSRKIIIKTPLNDLEVIKQNIQNCITQSEKEYYATTYEQMNAEQYFIGYVNDKGFELKTLKTRTRKNQLQQYESKISGVIEKKDNDYIVIIELIVLPQSFIMVFLVFLFFLFFLILLFIDQSVYKEITSVSITFSVIFFMAGMITVVGPFLVEYFWIKHLFRNILEANG